MTGDDPERLGQIVHAMDRDADEDLRWEDLYDGTRAAYVEMAEAVAAAVRRTDRAKLERRRDAYRARADANPNAYWLDLASAFEEAIAILSGEKDA